MCALASFAVDAWFEASEGGETLTWPFSPSLFSVDIAWLDILPG